MCIQSIVLAFRYFHLQFRAALLLAGRERCSVSWRGFLCWGRHSQVPQGSNWGLNQNIGKCSAPDIASTCSSGPALGAGTKRNSLFLQTTHLRSQHQLWGSAHSVAIYDRYSVHCRVHSPSRTGGGMQWRWVVEFCGHPAVERLSAWGLEPGGLSPWSDSCWLARQPWGGFLRSWFSHL